MKSAEFAPIQRLDGYLPLEDYGLIGDGTTAGLVSRSGGLDWLCLPRFDSAPLFCRLLDRRRGGHFSLAPEGLAEARQFYEDDTAVLVTEMRTREGGLLRLRDALVLKTGSDLSEDTRLDRSELIRHVEVLSGSVRLRVELEANGGCEPEQAGGGIRLRWNENPQLPLRLACSRPLRGFPDMLALSAGESVYFVLTWAEGSHRFRPIDARELLDATAGTWRRWLRGFQYQGPEEALVRRSALTLKLLDYSANGALLAAPTSSLPECIGGERNWDYRFAWIRDAAFSVYALRRIGFTREASAFLGWVMDAVERKGRPRVLYNLDGELPPPEREDQELEGYRRSRPVRWGNAAADQRQHDVYGEIIDCAYQWASWGGQIDAPLWRRLRDFVEAAAREWREPDHGIWEARTPGHVYTYSAATCHMALQRGADLSQRLGLPGDPEAWRREAGRILRAILEEAWDERKQAITQQLGGGALDASILTLPLRRVLPYDHPKMVPTVRAIQEGLSAGNGLLYRYHADEAPDGLEGKEGAFLLCSFWLVDNLTGQGRLDEAMDLYHSLCSRAGALGLLPEQIDPATGAFLGNYPQAFSHVGVIASGVNLALALQRGRK